MAYNYKDQYSVKTNTRETMSLLSDSSDPSEVFKSSSVRSRDTQKEIVPVEDRELAKPQVHAVAGVSDDGESWELNRYDSENNEGAGKRYVTCYSNANVSNILPLTDGSQNDMDLERVEYIKDAALYIREGNCYDKFDIHPTGGWSRRAFQVLHHPVFHWFHLCVCTLYLLLALIEEPSAVPHESGPAGAVVLGVNILLEIFILGIIWLHMVFRFLWFKQKLFRYTRTTIILLVLVVMTIDIIAQQIVAAVNTHHYPVHLVVLRAFRPIFLIDTHLMSGVRRVLNHILVVCLRSILDVLLLMMLVLVVFSIVGYLLFAEIDPTYFVSLSKSFVSLFIAMTTSNHPDVILEAYDRHPASPLFFVIYIIVMVYLVVNVLLAVVYTAFKTADKKKFKKLYKHKIEALCRAFDELKNPTGEGVRFHDFLLFMHFYRPRVPEWQVMCIFKAMQKNPEQGQEQQHNPQQGHDPQQDPQYQPKQELKELSLEEFYRFYEVRDYKWKLVNEDGEDLMWFEKPGRHKCLKTVARWTYRVVKTIWFDLFVNVVIIANILFLTVYTLFITEKEAKDRYHKLNNVTPVSLGFVIFYMLEICLKIFVSGFTYYYRKKRNVTDTIVVVISFVLLIIEASSPAYAYLAVLRPIKFFRLLRLKRSYRDIIRALRILSYRLFSIGVLLVIIYFSFAIIGIEFFSGAIKEGCCNESWFDIGEYYSGNNHTFDTNVYYDLNFDHILNSYLTLFVLMVVNNWYILMEGFASTTQNHWIVRLYFIAFFIIMLMVLQVIISFIVDAFETGMLVVKEERRCLREYTRDYAFILVDERDSKGFRKPYHKSRKHKKITTIKFLALDIQKLNEEVDSSDRRPSHHGNALNLFIQRRKRIKLAETPLTFTGRRSRTKDDLHREIYKEKLPKWIRKQEEYMNKNKKCEDDENELKGFRSCTIKCVKWLFGKIKECVKKMIIACVEFIVR